MSKGNIIYCAVCEVLQTAGVDGEHRLAQRIAKAVEVALLQPKQKAVYSALTDAPQRVIEIAKAINQEQTGVASQLCQLEKKGLAFSTGVHKKRRTWKKT